MMPMYFGPCPVSRRFPGIQSGTLSLDQRTFSPANRHRIGKGRKGNTVSKRILAITLLLTGSPLFAQDLPTALPPAIQKLIGGFTPLSSPVHLGRNGYQAHRTWAMDVAVQGEGDTALSWRVENEFEEHVEFKGDRLFFTENLVSSRLITGNGTREETPPPSPPVTIELASSAEKLYEIKDYSVTAAFPGIPLKEALGEPAPASGKSAVMQRYVTMQYASPNLSIYFIPGITKSGFAGGYPGGATPTLLMKMLLNASSETDKPQSVPSLLVSWKAEGSKDGVLVATVLADMTNDEGTVHIDLAGYRLVDIETGRIAEEEVTLHGKLQGSPSKSGNFTLRLKSVSKPAKPG